MRNVNAYSGWNRVYGIVCDNGPNVQAVADYLPQETIDGSPPCLGHTVQLVVQGSIDSQRAAIDVLAAGWLFLTNLSQVRVCYFNFRRMVAWHCL